MVGAAQMVGREAGTSLTLHVCTGTVALANAAAAAGSTAHQHKGAMVGHHNPAGPGEWASS